MNRTQTPLNLVPDTRAMVHGIEVREEELVRIKAQLLYRMRCECGRSWFDVRLLKLAVCPACEKKGMVSV